MGMRDFWDGWEEEDFFSPEGDESLGGRLTRFIIDQVPESKLWILDIYTFAEQDDYLIFQLMGGVFDFDVTLTPQFIAEIRHFTIDEPGDYARATLGLLDEYLETHARPHAKTAVPA